MKSNDADTKRKESTAESRVQGNQPRPARAGLGSYEGIMTLQRLAGNRAVAQLMNAAQTADAPIQRQSGLNSLGAISLDLAGGDVAKADVIRRMIDKYGPIKVRSAAIDLPDAFASLERAEMTMQFLEQPGAGPELAAVAQRLAGAADDRYLKLLKLMLDAKAAAGSMDLDAARLEIVCALADEIGENKGHLQYVVLSVVRSDDLEATAKKLDRVKTFNFNEKLEQKVDSEAKKFADWNLKDKLFAIDKEESEQKKKAFDDQREAASQVPKVKKEKSEFKKGQLLGEEQQKRAKPKQDEIALDAEKKRQDAKGPEYELALDERKGKYAQYYQAVGFHPQADAALAMASNWFDQALKIMDIVMLGKDGETLAFKSGLSIDKLIGLRNKFAPGQIAQLLQQLKIAGLTPFMEYPIYTAFLKALLAQVPWAPLQDLAKYVGKFHAYCEDPAATGHFVTLVQGYSVKEIVNLLEAAPPYKTPDVNKMSLLVALSAKADSASTLLAALNLCERAEWDAARVLAEQGAWPDGAKAAELELAIEGRMMANIDKDDQFARWIKNLAVLAEKGYHTITYGNVVTLGGKMLTKEVLCTVSGNGLNESFVVHGHPGAGKAQVGSPNASDIHLKPSGGYNVNTRLKREQIPVVIWNGIGDARRKELTKQ
ncbi:hypothetical protein [Paenibacillus arenilitoris]|uniref:Uncharacterized protein n=1 Tax=Paenibacillus arenilitoris TaxID=2772299 RepID=A0A927CQB0_9BACL|nr:hypothetical protein [Paenibacillus arenilitoris]MBD2869981.1 hypothetical protein [Paenibacillus arenilitoris]